MAETIVFIICALLPAYGLRFKIGPLPTTGLEIVLFIAIGILAYEIFILKNFPHRPEPSRRSEKLLWTGTILILIATITGIIVAPGKLAALGIARAYFWEPIIFSLLLIKIKPDGKKIFKAALYGFALNAALIIGYGIFQYFFPRLIPATYAADRRITSFYSYPNAIALYLAPLIPLFLSALWSLPLVIFGIVAIALAQSAGGLVAVFAALFVVGLSFKKSRAATVIAAVLVGVALAFAPQLSGLREQIFMKDWSGRVHEIGWQESIAMLRDHPLWGAGLSGYPTVVKPYHTAVGVEIFQYPHDLFLAIWSELGLLGLFGFLIIFVWFFKTVFRRYALYPKPYTLKLLAAAMVAILVHGLVDVPYFKNDLSLMFWILIAITAIMNGEYARQ
jgi:O-Antigen ligase